MNRRRRNIEKFSKFVSNTDSDFEVYKKGAIIGGLIGGITGIVAGRKVLLFMFIGAVAGGYINYKVNEDDGTILSLRKFSKSNNNNNN